MKLGLLLVLLLTPVGSLAQQKMDLDDINIKGELHGDDRLRMIARDKNRLKNYVKYRTSYRAEIIQGLMRPEPQIRYEAEDTK